MKNRIYKLSGIAILVFTLVANLQYALSDYGLGSANLGSQLMAQGATSSSITDVASDGTNTGTSTSAGGASPHCYDQTTYDCDDDGGGFGVMCSFTGRYGSPTTCSSVGCGIFGVLFGSSNRHCVKG